jgi:hypothetical protein
MEEPVIQRKGQRGILRRAISAFGRHKLKE